MERENQTLWLQGMYIYEAIGDMAPILHAFAKKGAKPTPYPEQPYALNAERKQKAKAREDKKKMDYARTRL